MAVCTHTRALGWEPRMAQEEPPYTGLVRLHHPETGALLEEGWRAEGQREGLWRWYAADGSVACEAEYHEDLPHGAIRYFAPDGRLTAEGQHQRGKRQGVWRWWHPDGSLREEAGYADDRLDGPYRTAAPGGAPLSEGRYARGRQDGRWRLYGPQGELLEDAWYQGGRRSGELRRRDQHGQLISTLWEAGVPVLPRKRWEGLAARLRRGGTAWKKLDAISELVGMAQRVPALWWMQQQGLIQLGDLPDLWPELADRWAETLPEEAAGLLGRLRTLEPGGTLARGLHRSWPWDLDRLVMPLYAENPLPFDRVWAGWSEPVRLGFALVLRRFERLSRKELPSSTAEDLAEVHIRRGGLKPKQLDQEGGRLIERTIGSPDQAPTAEFRSFIERFCTPEQWSEGCLRVALSVDQKLSPTAAWDAFPVAQGPELAALLAAVSWSAPGAWDLHEHLLHTARPEPSELLALAQGLRGQREAAADLLTVLALRRLAAAGEVPPEGAEEGFGFCCFDRAAERPDAVAGLEATLEGLSALGLARGQALLRTALGREFGWEAALPALALFGDEELYDQALQRLARAPAESPAEARFVCLGLASLGTQALPWLAEAFDALREQAAPAMADAVSRAALWQLAALAEAGDLPGPEWDHFCTLHGLADRSLSDHSFNHLVAPPLSRVLRLLPEHRVLALLRAQLDPQALNPARPLFALTLRQEPRLLELLFGWLGECAARLSQGSLSWVEQQLRGLGESALPHAARAVLLSEHEPLRVALGAALGEQALNEALQQLGYAPLDPARALARLAEPLLSPEGPREPILVLRALPGSAAAADLNRMGGVPAGLGPERWPTAQGQPMACVLTLDLRQFPELQALAPGAAALAVFQSATVSSESAGVRVLALSEAEAQASRVEDPHARALELTRVELPSGVWGALYGPLRSLRQAVGTLSARALGRPTGAGAPERSQLLLQLDSGFLPLPAPAGVIYLFAEDLVSTS